jgi:hypothetical protein
MQIKVLRTTDDFVKNTSVCDLHVANKLSCVPDCIKICYRQQAEIMGKKESPNHQNVVNGEA